MGIESQGRRRPDSPGDAEGRTVAVIPARFASTRLPGKPLLARPAGR
jgi:hypothetical protein